MATEMLSGQPDEEQRILAQVSERLVQRFPQVHPTAVAEAVRRSLDSFADARIREFVEIFVEREASAILRVYSPVPVPAQHPGNAARPASRRRPRHGATAASAT